MGIKLNHLIQNYLGFDISNQRLSIYARRNLIQDDNKKFLHTSEYIDQKLSLQFLDVIFHLIEDDV